MAIKTPTTATDRLTNDPVGRAEQSADKKFGVFIGVVRSMQDEAFTGKIQVFIPELGKDAGSNNGVYDCFWSSPFAGATSPNVDTDVKSYRGTRQSYGMWMRPPDKDNIVLVCFADGNSKLPYIIGCTFPPMLTHMVPGVPAGKSYSESGIKVPVAEKNSRDEKTTHNDATRPMHVDIAEHIVKQGLINDPLRGSGTSGSRRETPSEVFGILTPGPPDPKDPKVRMGGHQFVMDDGLRSGSRHIRLRTAQGNQILMDDMLGLIYLINKKGNAWFEMDMNGHVQIYAEGGISMRTRGNFNLRADKNVNIEAGNDVQIRAAGDNVGVLSTYDYLGPNPMSAIGKGPLGTGGDVRIEAAGQMSALATTSMKHTALGGDYDLSVGGLIRMTAGNPAPAPAGGITLTTPGGILLDSTLETRVQSKTSVGISAAAGAVNIVGGPLINLNSSVLPPIIPVPAKAAPQMSLTANKDQPFDAPKFNREAALKGTTALEGGGLRTGKVDNVRSIVANFITAEPFSGHSNADPTKENPKTIGNNKAFVPGAPGASPGNRSVPATVINPNGTVSVGTGYADANGNLVTGSRPTGG